MVENFGIEDLFDGPPSEETIKDFTYQYGMPAELFFKNRPVEFDFIVSRAVLEHLMDPIAMLTDAARTLKSEGKLLAYPVYTHTH